jgi:hypothetical protein
METTGLTAVAVQGVGGDLSASRVPVGIVVECGGKYPRIAEVIE